MTKLRLPGGVVFVVSPQSEGFVPLVSCGCGITYDRTAWRVLPYVGLMPDGAGGVLELRNCGCGSSLSVQKEFPE